MYRGVGGKPIQHRKIEDASNRSGEYSTDTTDWIRKLLSRITNIPSVEGPDDGATDRVG